MGTWRFTSNNPSSSAPPQFRALRPRLTIEIALLIIAIFAGALLVARANAEHYVYTRHLHLQDAFRTPATFIGNNEIQGRGVAILIHGFQCNKSMMVKLGKFLANAGMSVYAIDLPGHGDSPIAFTKENSYEAARVAVSTIIRQSGVDQKKVVLIGHSFGASTLAPVALDWPNLGSSIYIGPGELKLPDPKALRNVMVLTAERDYAHIKDYALKAVASLTEHAISSPSDYMYGDKRAGTARIWKEILGVDHVSLLHDATVRREVKDWIEGTLQVTLENTDSDNSYPALLVAISLIASLVVVSLFAKILFSRTTTFPQVYNNNLQPVLVILCAITMGTVLAALSAREMYLHLLEGETLILFSTSFGFAGLITSFLVRKWRKPCLSGAIEDCLLGGASFTVLYTLAVLTIEPEFHHLAFPAGHVGRIKAFVVTFGCVLPYFFLHEEMHNHAWRALRSVRGGEGLALALSGALHSIFLIVQIALVPPLIRFIVPFSIVIAYCMAAGWIIRRYRKSALSSALFVSLTVSWLISVGFIYY